MLNSKHALFRHMAGGTKQTVRHNAIVTIIQCAMCMGLYPAAGQTLPVLDNLMNPQLHNKSNRCDRLS